VRPGGSLVTPDLLPVLGYDAARELTLRGLRQARALDERAARARWAGGLAVRADSVAGAWDVEVEGEAADTLLAPGDLVAETRVSGRLRRTFRVAAAGAPPLYVVAGPHATHTSTIDGLRVDLVSHRDHAFNNPHWQAAVRRALATLTPVLGRYPTGAVRLVEVPFGYLDAPVTCANLVLVPETNGWLHDYRTPVAFDWIGYVTARELSRGWLAQIAPPSDAPGSVLLSQGLPAALALWTLEAANAEGAAAYRLRLADRYLRESNLEDGLEPALVDGDDEPYLSDKAAFAIDATRRRLGDPVFADVVGAAARSGGDFAQRLEHVAGSPDARGAIAELLRAVVVYDLRVRRAEVSAQSSTPSLRADLAAQRFVATATDNRTPAPIVHARFPVRLTSADGRARDTQAAFANGDVAWEAPAAAERIEIDAAALWLDRDRQNNRAAVSSAPPR
jgi:hypothetical protein